MKVYTLFTYAPVRGMERFFMEFDFGCSHNSDEHDSGVEEYIFVAIGKLLMILNGREIILEEKHPIRFRGDIPNSYNRMFENICEVYNIIFYPVNYIESLRRSTYMSIDIVKEYFKKFGIENRILEFDVSSATVELAAKALKCEPCRIAKTLSFMVDGNPILIVTAGDAKIDNTKYKARFKTKAKMLAPDEVLMMVGHAVGGVCPFAVNDMVTVYLDKSLKRFGTVFPACGSGNSAIELTIDELEKYSNYYEWIDVCKGYL